MTPPELAEVRRLTEAYGRLLQSDRPPDQLRHAVRTELRVPLLEFSRHLLSDIQSVVEDGSPNHIFELETILLLACPLQEQQTLFSEIEQQLWRLAGCLSHTAWESAGHLIGCLLAALDDLPPDLIDRVFAILGALTDREEGIRERADRPRSALPRQALPKLSNLLDLGLFSEVFAFLAGTRGPNANFPEGPLDVGSVVASLVSRKGGVGKSTIAFATVLLLARSQPNRKICLFDLDLTGPAWQYFLQPSSAAADDGVPYLNDLFDIAQPSCHFEFGEPTADEVLQHVARMRIPALGFDLGLLTFADWPRTNRYLIQAIADNRESFGKFLDALVVGLSKEFDTIIIDNAPGFHPHSLLSLAVVGRIRRGFPIVVSTPMLPDLRGTLLELSDIRFLHAYRPPIWIVNQASEEARDFFAMPRSLPDIAALMPTYQRDILPPVPLLARASNASQGGPERSYFAVRLNAPVCGRYRSWTGTGHAAGPIRRGRLLRKLCTNNGGQPHAVDVP